MLRIPSYHICIQKSYFIAYSAYGSECEEEATNGRIAVVLDVCTEEREDEPDWLNWVDVFGVEPEHVVVYGVEIEPEHVEVEGVGVEPEHVEVEGVGVEVAFGSFRK